MGARRDCIWMRLSFTMFASVYAVVAAFSQGVPMCVSDLGFSLRAYQCLRWNPNMHISG